jgi:hypothetical protein
LYGPTGKVKPFGQKDNGGDLVESCFLMQSLLCVRQYFRDGNEQEKALAEKIDQLWKEMEFSWYQNGKDVIYWHWSPEYNWEMNFPLEGYNEALIVYVLAASSPTYPVPASAYHNGWARGGGIKSDSAPYGLPLELKHNGAEKLGGPLFWAQYSHIGLDPRNLSDRYANYWNVVRNHALSNYRYCVENPKQYKGYGEDCWGLTASYSTKGYAAHCPGDNDHGVITPTAALTSSSTGNISMREDPAHTICPGTTSLFISSKRLIFSSFVIILPPYMILNFSFNSTFQETLSLPPACVPFATREEVPS